MAVGPLALSSADSGYGLSPSPSRPWPREGIDSATEQPEILKAAKPSKW